MMFNNNNAQNKLRLQRNVLTLAILASAGITGNAYAQATNGSIYGTVPVSAGETITVVGESGFTRSVPVDDKGRYQIGSLPLGTYTVSLKQGDQVVDTRNGIGLRVGAGVEVDFQDKSAAKSLSTVTVVGNTTPPIDVTSTDTRTVITADQLAKLPLARTAEAIALLAPGVTPGYSGFTGSLGNSLDSFGGSSVTENAYYVNGMNTTDPLSGFGGITLPYGAIDQQEILTGGYGAQYGRSDGGVISQNGKRGTNEWHFGFQEQFTPSWSHGTENNTYYVSGDEAGQIYDRRNKDKQEELTQSAYVGGPLIKDKLFFFLAAEGDRRMGNAVGSVSSPYNTQYSYSDPKLYVKLDWNINDSNILEFTHASNKNFYTGADYNYDYTSNTTGSYAQSENNTSTKANIDVLKYTSYITDDLTLSILYGKQKINYYNNTPGSSSDPYISGTALEDPSITGGTSIAGSNPVETEDDPSHKSTTDNLRVDLSYKLGDHTLSLGIDNQNEHDVDDGTSTSGPGYYWVYGESTPGKDISSYVGSSANGYYAEKVVYNTAASVRVKQRAWYLQDNWQVTDRILLDIGLRDDAFTNYNPDGQAFLRLTKPQWAPRVGASWDVNGDSSFKVYANAGRYYLAMPASVALRAASSSTYATQYYEYTGISSNGVPTGLTLIPTTEGDTYYQNAENGKSPDAKTVASSNIKSEYQDEFILGFQHDLNFLDTSWVYGAKAQARKLRNILDDICDTGTIESVAEQEGYTNVDTSAMNGCYLSNPGRSNTYELKNTSGGYDSVTVSAEQFGDPKPKRNYYSMELFLEHPFDGKWYGKIDYLWSHSLGNTEGQVRSDIGQTDVSATEDWDYGQVEQYAGGDLANDRRHQLKAYGSYQVTPEWMLSASLMLLSGTPKDCLGYYGVDQTDPIGYGNAYHWCGGEPSRPGDAGRTPWQHIVSLTAEYRPAFADHKLAFNVMIYNLLNESVPTSYYAEYGQTGALNSNYMRALYWSEPRYVRFGVSYDF